MKKKLIYFTLGNNPQYIELAKFCIDSIYNVGYDGDLMFITNLKTEILEKIEFKKQPIFFTLSESDLFNSSANKLRIYEYEKINEYEKIIFSDLDILWLSNPDYIFDLINTDEIYVSNEDGLMCQDFWGGQIFTEEEKKHILDNNIYGVNAGIFALNTNMISHLKNIYEFLIENIHLSNVCLEQPFFNVYLHRNKIYNNSLNGLVSHKGYSLNEYDGVALHFAGGPGNFTHKFDKMNKFFNKLINNYDNF